MAPLKTKDPRKRLEQLDARRREIGERAAALRGQADALRAEIATAVVAGDDPAPLRGQLQAATAELGELGLAAPHLEQSVAAALQEIAAADRAAKRKALEDLLAEAAGTADAIDDAMTTLQAALRRRIDIGERLQAAAVAAGQKPHAFRTSHLAKWVAMQLHQVFGTTDFDYSAPMARPLAEVDREFTRAPAGT